MGEYNQVAEVTLLTIAGLGLVPQRRFKSCLSPNNRQHKFNFQPQMNYV